MIIENEKVYLKILWQIEDLMIQNGGALSGSANC
jgi:hypothetical protein